MRALVPRRVGGLLWPRLIWPRNPAESSKERVLSHGPRYTPEQQERLRAIHSRLIEARRELDALIGDAYLRPRASIVPVHFLDLASAVEKLRWAEKEWRELDQELESGATVAVPHTEEDEEGEDEDAELVQIASN